jgi:hypothetical protein
MQYFPYAGEPHVSAMTHGPLPNSVISNHVRGLIPNSGEPQIPPPCMTLRARKEMPTRDSVNARQFEHWQTDTPILQPEFKFKEPLFPQMDVHKDAIYDMNPISSRLDARDFKQARPFEEMGPSLAQNPYFDRYDPTRDPRNAIRELRSVVSEDRFGEKGVLEARRLLDRGFSSRWVPVGYAEQQQMDTLLAYESIRPKQDDIAKSYRVNQK